VRVAERTASDTDFIVESEKERERDVPWLML
jgi:hypothetical protein